MLFSLLSLILANGSPVDPKRLALELSSADWFGWVKVWGYVVAAGCAMEAWEVFITMKSWWHIKYRDRDIPEDKKSWAVPLATLGLSFIVFGIILETYCEGKVSDAETELREHLSGLITVAEDGATSAIREAGNAKNSAEAASRAAENARGAAFVLQKDAAILEREFVKNETRFTLIRSRRLDLARKLKKFSGQRFATYSEYVPSDREGIRASSQIIVLLEHDSGWVNNIPNGGLNGQNIFGIGITVRILPRATKETRRAALALFSDLKEALISGVYFVDTSEKFALPFDARLNFDEQTVLIEVGEHPLALSPPSTSTAKSSKKKSE